jgi:hypothetical protein
MRLINEKLQLDVLNFVGRYTEHKIPTRQAQILFVSQQLQIR